MSERKIQRVKEFLSKAPWLGAIGLALAIGYGWGSGFVPGTERAEKQEAHAPASIQEPAGDAMEIQAHEEAAGFGADTSLGQLKRTMGMAHPKTRDREMENALSRMSLEDVKKALEWASALPESAAKRSLLSKIIERWGQLDGENAVAYGEKVFAETGNPQWLKDAIRGWGETDPNGSIQYVQSMSMSDAIQRDISRDLYRDWADRSPLAAAAYAAAHPIDVGRGGVMSLIADRWSKQDPPAAANWVMTLPQGRDQQRALNELVQNWADLNLQAAADFVSRQPEGANREVMVGTLAREVAKKDAVAALQWTATLRDPNTQSKTALSFMWRSARQDLASAQRMVNSSALSRAAKEEVLSKMTNGYGGRRGGGL